MTEMAEVFKRLLIEANMSTRMHRFYLSRDEVVELVTAWQKQQGRGEAVNQLEVDWDLFQSVADLPAVDTALRDFVEDSTGDNAVCLVRAVLTAAPAPAEPESERPPQFESAEALALWLEKLYSTTPDGAVCANKWEPAQVAARAVRGQSCPPAPAAVPEGLKESQAALAYLVEAITSVGCDPRIKGAYLHARAVTLKWPAPAPAESGDDPQGLRQCTHSECGRFFDPNAQRQSCRAIADGACAAPQFAEPDKDEQ